MYTLCHVYMNTLLYIESIEHLSLCLALLSGEISDCVYGSLYILPSITLFYVKVKGT